MVIYLFKKFFYSFILFSLLIVIFSSNQSNNQLSFSLPIKDKYVLSSLYGYRELFGQKNFHNGIDFAAVQNTPVYAIEYGTVIYNDFNIFGYGNTIIILHNNGYKSLYAHLSNNSCVNVGDIVLKGEQISSIGPKILDNGISNGNTTGPHLHLTVYDINGDTINPLKLYDI